MTTPSTSVNSTVEPTPPTRSGQVTTQPGYSDENSQHGVPQKMRYWVRNPASPHTKAEIRTAVADWSHELFTGQQQTGTPPLDTLVSQFVSQYPNISEFDEAQTLCQRYQQFIRERSERQTDSDADLDVMQLFTQDMIRTMEKGRQAVLTTHPELRVWDTIKTDMQREWKDRPPGAMKLL